jgi:protoheme IX farnesyltransferase
MSTKIISINKLNHVNNFNFFFHNSKKRLLIQQNFIGNQFLASHRYFNRSRVKHSNIAEKSVSSAHDKTVLQEVTAKVLTCQDGTETAIKPANIPFDVKPKAVRQDTSLKALIKPYIKLTKPNLTLLVTLSSICTYAISPYTVSVPELMFLTMGTVLCSGSANAINMGREPAFDARMVRTSSRPVVTGQITSKQAFQFAAIAGALGGTMLYFGVNPTVSFLGLLNIALYGWIYTSLKRKSIINTWVGAIVGAIPPLMGWAASSSLMHAGAWCLAGLLYAWQFPHFNSLSHNIALQYKEAGYVMTAAENPKLNARVSLRYSILMFPLCFGLSYFDVTDWWFLLDSAIANGWLTVLAYQFWKQQKINYSNPMGPTPDGINLANIQARKLFWGSVYHLPAVLILAMLHKKGQWDRLFHYLGFASNNESQTFA